MVFKNRSERLEFKFQVHHLQLYDLGKLFNFQRPQFSMLYNINNTSNYTI